MKIFAAFLVLCLVALARSEPPVQNQYLPPHQTPSNNYLPPTSSFGSGPSGFSAPSAPQQSQYQAPSTSYGAPSTSFSAPSNQYGAPAVTSAIFQKQPQSTYGAPSRQGGSSDGGYSSGGIGGGYSGGAGGYSSGAGGYSGAGGRYQDEEGKYGPAKYEFQYDVQDYESGQDFGHMESREGDRSVGRYYVLLPDGRKQIVNYVADETGYHPTITYEDTNRGSNRDQGQGGYGGYDNNAQSKFNGY